jgi:Caspase domain/Effector-associated domain 11
MSTFAQGYALLIGVGNDLPATVQDVRGVERLLLDKNRAAYPREQVMTLTEKDASKLGMLEAFEKFPILVNKTEDTDKTVLIYYSGHGAKDEDGIHYLIPNDHHINRAIPSSKLADCIEALNAERIVVLLDCCFAGDAKDKTPDMEPDVELLAKALRQGKGKIVIASSSGLEKSYISKTSQYSNFTEVLLEGLDGRFEDNPDEKFVHILALADYVTREVPKREKRQTPQINNASNLTNFPLCAFNFEKSKSEPFDGLYPPNAALDPHTRSLLNPNPDMDNILNLIDSDMLGAFDALDQIDWGNKKGQYLDLKEQWIDPPNNFSKSDFRSRLKVLVKSTFRGNQVSPRSRVDSGGQGSDPKGAGGESNLNQIKKTAKEKLIRDFADAIKYLETQLQPDNTSKNTLLLMQGELSNLKRQEMLGLMSFDQITLSKNQLRARLLSLIDGIEAEEIIG